MVSDMERNTFTAEVEIPEDGEPATKVMTFYEPTEGQLAMLVRGAGLAQRSAAHQMRGVAMILDVIDALCVSPDDREALTEAMIAGDLELNGMISILEGIRSDEEAPKNGPVKKAPARRGRR